MNTMLRNGFESVDFHDDWCLPVLAKKLYDQRQLPDQFSKLNTPPFRPVRIPAWLTHHPSVENFVIIDDACIKNWVPFSMPRVSVTFCPADPDPDDKLCKVRHPPWLKVDPKKGFTHDNLTEARRMISLVYKRPKIGNPFGVVF